MTACSQAIYIFKKRVKYIVCIINNAKSYLKVTFDIMCTYYAYYVL